MPVPAGNVDIVNQALAILYQPPITSLTDQNVPAASIALRSFDSRRRYWLRAMIWNFARWRGTATLIQNTTPPFDFANYYQLPGDFMRLDQLGPDWRRYDPLWYDIQGSYICLNPTCPVPPAPLPSIDIKYQRDMPDVTTWDPTFVDVMVLDMAMRMCLPVTADQAMMKLLNEWFTLTLKDAQAANHSDRPVIVTEHDPIERARRAASEIWNISVNPASWGTDDAS